MGSEIQISIIAISDIKLKETIKALEISSKSLNPTETLLFTSKSINLSNDNYNWIKIIKIDPISSIKEYSNFVIYNLYKYIKTSHILIVQWDGFICNKKKWDKNFLKYDYIGAPFIPRESDHQYSRDKNDSFYIIGNGGFSLRSKRLLEAPSKYNLKDNKDFTNNHEDGFFSVYHRKFLESKGYIWAPFFLAEKFSIESPLTFKQIKDLPFGFHGRRMFYILKTKILLKNLFIFLKTIF